MNFKEFWMGTSNEIVSQKRLDKLRAKPNPTRYDLKTMAADETVVRGLRRRCVMGGAGIVVMGGGSSHFDTSICSWN